jgi:hypothetical protein
MSKSLRNRRAFYCIWLLAIAVICILTTGKIISSATSSSSPATSSSHDGQITIRSLAVGMQILSQERLGQTLKVTFQNNYGKGITSFDVALGGGRYVQSELLSSDESLPAGGTWIEKYDVDADLLKEGATVRAVVFEDGTGDGDARSLRMMLDIRAGERRVYERAIPLLKRLENSADDRFDDNLANLPAALKQLSVPEDQSLHGYEKAGFENASSSISTEVEFLRRLRYLEGGSKARENLHRLTLRKEGVIQSP